MPSGVDLIIKKKIEEFIRSAYANAIFQQCHKILDVGCGKKPYLHYFRQKFYVGLDIKSSVKPDIIASADHLPFRNDAFDLVLLIEVLEHVPEPVKVLEEIRRVLRNGGFLFAAVPQYWFLHEEPSDYWRFTSYGLSYMLKRSGLKLVRLEPIGGRILLLGTQLVSVLISRLGELGEKFISPLVSPIMTIDAKHPLYYDTLGYICLAVKEKY